MPYSEELNHHGIKGMHWGQHKANTSGSSGPSHADGPSRLHKALTKAEARKSAHDANHKLYSSSLHEHEKNGHKSKLMQTVYGVNVNTDRYSFKAIHGKAIDDAHHELSLELKNEIFRAKNGSARQQRKIDRIKAKMAKVKHGLELNDLDAFLAHIEDDDDDVLNHHGIKGMHWGVRRNRDSGSSGGSAKPKKVKVTSNDIHNARFRQNVRLNKVISLNDDVMLKTGNGKKQALRELGKVGNELANGKDAKLATRMTTGEKWAMGIGWGTVAVSIIAAGAVGATGGSRRL